ncbi:Paralemmin-3 [Galemys pyrenaicus]|uniref:Paralemmin-3 n=1 Tax=Galemys pyrenaicus TaxID=202257 RepID=A0A8J6AKW7_GALPY|nr:Paralemmin-3 [Galemys pyrenaicus]
MLSGGYEDPPPGPETSVPSAPVPGTSLSDPGGAGPALAQTSWTSSAGATRSPPPPTTSKVSLWGTSGAPSGKRVVGLELGDQSVGFWAEMALESQVWAPATPMPVPESSLYRQRLEVIAEKRRLQEEIRAARRELEEEKLRVERLKVGGGKDAKRKCLSEWRKSLRERWLMDGAAEGPELPEDTTPQGLQSPQGQAQARIKNLEDSLFTLQSQLQLLQSASTGALHKISGKPTWRRQGHRPLSQLSMETGPAGQTDVDRRASLPAGLVGTPPEFPSEPRDEAVGVPPAVRLVPGAAGPSSEANGPCSELSSTLSPGTEEFKGSVGETKGGGVVKVVWEGLRATEDCATEATGPELEAKVEELVLEAIGERQEADRLELPSWVKEDRGIVEVIWEGVGGPEGTNSEATGEASRGPEAVPTSSPRILEGLEETASHEGERASRSSPDGDRQGGSGGVEGSFIWVERVTLTEEWEELQVEGVGGPRVTGREGGDESSLGAEERRVEESWEVEKRLAEQSVEKENDEKAGTEWEGEERSLVGERKGSEESLPMERRGDEEPLSMEREEVAERERGKEPLGVEKTGDEKKLEEAEKPLVMERRGKISLKVEKGREEALKVERKEGKEALKVGREGGEEALKVEREGEEALKVEGGRGEEALEADGEGDEDTLKVERREGEEALEVEVEGDKEALLAEEKGGEEVLLAENKRNEEELEAIQEPLVSERKGEASLKVVRGGEEALQAEEKGAEEALLAKNTQGLRSEKGLSSEEQRESGEGIECQAEEVSEAEKVSEAETPLGAMKEQGPEEGLQPQNLEGSPEETATKPQTLAKGQGPLGDTTPLLVETPAPQQPPECQPLLQVEGPSAHPVPTYAPDRQLGPSAPPEGEAASGPEQKTCQCCAVM